MTVIFNYFRRICADKARTVTLELMDTRGGIVSRYVTLFGKSILFFSFFLFPLLRIRSNSGEKWRIKFSCPVCAAERKEKQTSERFVREKLGYIVLLRESNELKIKFDRINYSYFREVLWEAFLSMKFM